MSRGIVFAWDVVATLLLSVILVFFIPKRIDLILAIAAIVFAVVALATGTIFKPEIDNLKLSKIATKRNLTALTVSVIAIMAIGIYDIARPAPSGNIYGDNIWMNGAAFSGTSSRQVNAQDAKPNEIPHQFTQFPCPNPADSPCSAAFFHSEITNDTDHTINIVSFNAVIDGKNYQLNFQRKGDCYSTPLTLERGAKTLIAFLIPALPKKLEDEYGRESRAPTIVITTSTNEHFNLINRGTPSDKQQHEDQFFEIVRECVDVDSKLIPTDQRNSRYTQADRDFITTMINDQGITINDQDVDDSLDQAHKVCATLTASNGKGVDGRVLVNQLHQWRPDLNQIQAGFFAGTAVKTYCAPLWAQIH